MTPWNNFKHLFRTIYDKLVFAFEWSMATKTRRKYFAAFASIWLFLVIILLFFGLSYGSKYVDPKLRVDCDPKPGTTRGICESRRCVWDEKNYGEVGKTIPKCYFPPGTGYVVMNQSVKNEIILVKSRQSIKNPFGKDFNELVFTYNKVGAGVHVTIATLEETRFLPPIPIDISPQINSSDNLNVFVKNSTLFSFSIIRESTGEEMWNTDLGGLLFADQFLQIATRLPTDKIYGFGEHIHLTLKHNLTEYRTWGMWSRDEKTDFAHGNTRNLYGVHPFYLGLEKDNKAHGVFIFNSNAQEVTLGPGPHLIYRTIGGQLEFFFFPGPTPEEVIQQYQQVIGKPGLPAYWTLGFQLCQWGYIGIDNVKKVVNRTIEAGIPLDVAYADIDYMFRYKDWTYDPVPWGGLPHYTKELHDMDMHLILIFDPAIEATSHDWVRAMEKGAKFVEWPNHDLIDYEIQSMYPLANDTKVMLGVVWPDNHVGFPDFMVPETIDWWSVEFEDFQRVVPFDGIWLDMNEPSNFGTNEDHPWYFDSKDHPRLKPLYCPLEGPNSKWDMPPYQSVNNFWWNKDTPPKQPVKNYLSTKSLCMIGEQDYGKYRLYDTHSLYGLYESMASREALQRATRKRGIVVSRSTFPSSGRYAGHWLGDNSAEWKDLRAGIIGAMEFNMFGIPYVGADICGFNEPTTEELCLRWQQMGAFQSYSRNHKNGKDQPPQDPAIWPSVAQAARKANLFRYWHLPYLYSLHFNATIHGGTVVRPVFFEFPEDSMTHDISFQFMWGSGMMVIPVVQPKVDSVNGYLPSGSKWYSMYDYKYGHEVPSGNHSFPAPWDFLIPVFIRGGRILPRQRPGMTTTECRKNEFQLVIALDDGPKNEDSLIAEGELYWDDGESIVEETDDYNFYHFKFEFLADTYDAELRITKIRDAQNLTLPPLENIEIFGYSHQPDLKLIHLDDQPILDTAPEYTSYDPTSRVLNITSSHLIDLNKNGPVWRLIWRNDYREIEEKFPSSCFNFSCQDELGEEK